MLSRFVTLLPCRASLRLQPFQIGQKAGYKGGAYEEGGSHGERKIMPNPMPAVGDSGDKGDVNSQSLPDEAYPVHSDPAAPKEQPKGQQAAPEAFETVDKDQPTPNSSGAPGGVSGKQEAEQAAEAPPPPGAARGARSDGQPFKKGSNK